MSDWQEILDDTRALLERSVNPRGRTIAVSPEVAAMLEAQHDAPAAPFTLEVESTPPAAKAPLGPVAATLDDLAATVSACEQCTLCGTRTQTVFGVGNPRADLVFVGEAPGEEEDRQGEPFVGRAGQLLTDIIEKGMKLKRSEIYICNVLKCRPPGNRNPSVEEMSMCEPYLVRQLELLQPRVICAVGGVAAKQLLKTDDGVGKLRGQWHDYQGIPLRVTYHPSYLLRQHGEKQRAEKRKVWEDVQEITKLLNG